MQEDYYRIPALSEVGCAARRKINHCEKYQVCQHRFEHYSAKPCSVNHRLPVNPSIIGQIEAAQEELSMLERGDSEEVFESKRTEINDILDATKTMIGNIIGSIGV
jgi:hypothetical protein